MTTVRAENCVRLPEMRTHTRRNGFLSDIRVACPGDQAALMRFCKPLLNNPDDLHGPIELQLFSF
jgi:hypothetical protein